MRQLGKCPGTSVSNGKNLPATLQIQDNLVIYKGHFYLYLVQHPKLVVLAGAVPLSPANSAAGSRKLGVTTSLYPIVSSY